MEYNTWRVKYVPEARETGICMIITRGNGISIYRKHEFTEDNVEIPETEMPCNFSSATNQFRRMWKNCKQTKDVKQKECSNYSRLLFLRDSNEAIIRVLSSYKRVTREWNINVQENSATAEADDKGKTL